MAGKLEWANHGRDAIFRKGPFRTITALWRKAEGKNSSSQSGKLASVQYDGKIEVPWVYWNDKEKNKFKPYTIQASELVWGCQSPWWMGKLRKEAILRNWS